MFLDVVESEVQLGQVREGVEGEAGNRPEVVVVQIENTELLQSGEGGRIYGLDPVLTEV